VQSVHDVIARGLPGVHEPILPGWFHRAFFAGLAFLDFGGINGFLKIPFAEGWMMNPCVVQNPMSVCAQFLRLPYVRDVNAERYRADFALQAFQGVHQVNALLVGQGAGGIHHPGEFHLTIAE
jgi:hypothetical protein